MHRYNQSVFNIYLTRQDFKNSFVFTVLVWQVPSLPVSFLCESSEACCCGCLSVSELLAWHSVMSTMVEPVRRGAFPPWHQTWQIESSPRLFSCPAKLSNETPFLFTPSNTAVCPGFSFVCFPVSSSLQLSHFLSLQAISPSVSPLNFILSFAPQRQSFTSAT